MVESSHILHQHCIYWLQYRMKIAQNDFSLYFLVSFRFNGDPSIDLLLLTTKVGGLGLNLTGADTVIFVEHDWNPMVDLQVRILSQPVTYWWLQETITSERTACCHPVSSR